MKALTKKQTVQAVLLLVTIIITICFIFSNSMETIPDSSAKSEELLRILTPALELFVGKGSVTNHLIRKLAHFIEFFVLGIELCAFCLLRKKPLVWAMFVGLCTALTDETIQIFYERGAQLQDVWLDFSAVACAAVLAYIFGIITRQRKERI